MVLGEIEGIAIVLRAVDVSADGVVVHLGARRNARTDELDCAFETAVEAWELVAVAARHRGQRPPTAPAQPGAMLGDVPLCLHDDAGTDYRWLGGQAAGTGTEWDALRRFGPAPPPQATRLSVSIDGSVGGHSLRL